MENDISWQFKRILGTGTFGTVELWSHPSEKDIAVKIFKPRDNAEKITASKEKEAQDLFKHEYIVKAVKVPEELFKAVKMRFRSDWNAMENSNNSNMPQIHVLGMEYANKGILSSLMQEPCNWCGMAEPLVDSIIEQLHSALYYMHENNVSHLDLKENNVLVFETPDGGLIFKLCDFSHFTSNKTVQEKFAGVHAYMFPGSGPGKTPNTKQCDRYALGVILNRCITGRYPFPVSGDRENSVYREVINKKEKHAIHGVKHGSSELIFYEELPDQTHLCRPSKRYYEKILQSLLNVEPNSEDNNWSFEIQAKLDSRTVTVINLQTMTIENIPYTKESFAKAKLSDILKIYAQKEKITQKVLIMNENGDILDRYSKLTSAVCSVSRNIYIFLMDIDHDFEGKKRVADKLMLSYHNDVPSTIDQLLLFATYHVSSVFNSKLNLMHCFYKAAKNLCSALFIQLGEEWHCVVKEALHYQNENEQSIKEKATEIFKSHLVKRADAFAKFVLNNEAEERDCLVKSIEQTRNSIYNIRQDILNEHFKKFLTNEKLNKAILDLRKTLSDFDRNVLELIRFTYSTPCTAISQAFKLRQFIKAKTSQLKNLSISTLPNESAKCN